MTSLRFATVLLAVALAGCTYIGQTTPEPTAAPTAPATAVAEDTPASPATDAPVPSLSVTPTAVVTPSDVASDTPTAEPSPTAEPTPTPEPATEVWRRVADFPPEGAEVTALEWDGSRFFAAGIVPIDAAICEDGYDGRIWVSPDGTVWEEAAQLPESDPFTILNAGGALFVFARGGNFCDYSEATRMWRSRDGGSSWDRLRVTLEQGDEEYLIAVTSVGDSLMALGEAYTPDGNSKGVVWTSGDGESWTRRDDGPLSNLDSWADIHSVGDTVVAVDSYSSDPIFVSPDGGRTWDTARYRPLAFVQPGDVETLNGAFVARARACCGLADVEVGMTLYSTDGVHWDETGAFEATAHTLLAGPESIVAVGEETWITTNGIDWRVAPPMPRFARNSWTLGTASTYEALVISGRFTWIADLADLMEARGGPPQAAARPEIGVEYPTAVWTHCGFPDVHFDLRSWVLDPPMADSSNPPPGFNESERGWYTLIDENHMRYENRRGSVLNFVPSDKSEVSGPCA